MNRDLIVFGEDWGALPSSTQHLIRHLSASRKVVWVNSIGLRRPTLTLKDIKRAWNKLTAPPTPAAKENNVRMPENFYLVNPTTLPAPRSDLARKIAADWLEQQLGPVLKKARLHRPIMWTSLPTAVDVADKMDASSLVYYCGDDFSSLAGVDHVTVSARERELVTKADLILAASESLYRRFPSSRTCLLPHGVDYNLFSTPAPRAKDFPDRGRPVAGFYGSMSEWLNYPMLEATIRHLKEWDFVFIGKPSERATLLARYPNVRLLGPRPHHLLPGYSQHWTASLLPFVDNGQIRACNPLKLREYIAAGRPVISTPFPALKDYRDIVTIVRHSSELIKALNHSQSKTIDTEQQQRVKSHTWQARAQELSKWLEAL